MVTKKLFIALLLIFPASSHGQLKRPSFQEISKGKQMDLLKEGSTLKLNQEDAVQEVNPPSEIFISILAGGFQPHFLSVESHGNTVNYSFSHLLPLGMVQFTHYPWRKSFGVLGWASSIGYSYSQYQDLSSTTALHIVPFNLNGAYRMELKSTQKVIPYLMAGPQVWTYFQRGLDEYNTSQSILFGSATLGLAFNLNHFHILSSRNDSEIIFQYQRTFGPSDRNGDFSGNAFEIGGTIAL